MAQFFRDCGQIDEPCALIDLIYRRYNAPDQILQMEYASGIHLISYAIKMEKEERFHREWVQYIPLMARGAVKEMNFRQYVDWRTGANIDTRPQDEIIAELEELHHRKLR